MIVIISPSKTLDFSTKINTEYSSPDFLKETSDLIQILRKLTKVDISRLMSLSDNLTSLNYVSANIKCTRHLHEKCTKKKDTKLKV